MIRTHWKHAVVTLCLAFVVGCSSWYMTQGGGDPNIPADPNAPAVVLSPEGEQIAGAIKTGEAVARGVSIFWPPAALISGILGTAGLALKKYKPKIAKAETQRDQFYAVAETFVYAVEQLKKDFPEDWQKHLEPILKKNIDPNGNIDAVIRALRGLPPKA